MKNDNVTSLWNAYKESLNNILIKKMTKIELAIEEFEKTDGRSLETMTRSESKILADLIGEGISYSSTVNYCCMLNKFLKMYEKKYNTRCEKVYANKNIEDLNLYLTEDQLIDDIEEHLNELITESCNNRHYDSIELKELEDSYLSNICIIILRWYGITAGEMIQIKMDDINGNEIKLPTRSKELSDRAISYINRYKEQVYITHFWRWTVRQNLPVTGYLFRKENIKNKDDSYQPMSLNLIAVMQHRFMKNSNIKKFISLSGAFANIKDYTTDPIGLCEKVREYMGDEPISDTNIKKYWINYLDTYEL